MTWAWGGATPATAGCERERSPRPGGTGQSSVAPVARISGAQRAISLFMYAANSAELEPTAIRPFAAYCSRTSAELRTLRRSVSSFLRIAPGVPFGASTPDPPPTSYPSSPDSSRVGTSGASASRVLVVTASARSLPLLMWGRTSGALLNDSSNCPLTSSVVICATDLYVTCCSSTPAIFLNSSPERCCELPLPGEPKRNLPGLARAQARRPLTDLIGTLGCTEWLMRTC